MSCHWDVVFEFRHRHPEMFKEVLKKDSAVGRRIVNMLAKSSSERLKLKYCPVNDYALKLQSLHNDARRQFMALAKYGEDSKTRWYVHTYYTQRQICVAVQRCLYALRAPKQWLSLFVKWINVFVAPSEICALCVREHMFLYAHLCDYCVRVCECDWLKLCSVVGCHVQSNKCLTMLSFHQYVFSASYSEVQPIRSDTCNRVSLHWVLISRCVQLLQQLRSNSLTFLVASLFLLNLVNIEYFLWLYKQRIKEKLFAASATNLLITLAPQVLVLLTTSWHHVWQHIDTVPCSSCCTKFTVKLVLIFACVLLCLCPRWYSGSVMNHMEDILQRYPRFHTKLTNSHHCNLNCLFCTQMEPNNTDLVSINITEVHCDTLRERRNLGHDDDLSIAALVELIINYEEKHRCPSKMEYSNILPKFVRLCLARFACYACSWFAGVPCVWILKY